MISVGRQLASRSVLTHDNTVVSERRLRMLTLAEEPVVATLTINTLMKGPIEINDEELISFIAPPLGLPAHLKRWFIYQSQTGAIYWLQSVDDEKVGFCLLAPFETYLDPEIKISIDDIADIGAHDASDIDLYTLVVLDQDPKQHRTNLRAPLFVCRSTRHAKQIVLSDSRLPIKFLLRDLNPNGK